MFKPKILAISCTAALAAFSSTAHSADVTIGVPNWPSVLATAHILKAAMEDNLDLQVDLQNGTNPVLFEAMDAGSVDVHPEVWIPNNLHLTRQFVDARQTVKMSPNSVAGNQGMCVTKATSERTGIVNLKDLADPAMAKNFDSDGDGKGEVWIGAEGWSSTTIEQVRARSYGYADTMDLEIKSEVQAMETLNAAVENDENIVFFCYTPHHMFTQHELVTLAEPAHDPTKWAIVQPSPTPGWLEKSRAGVAYETAQLHISYSASLEADQPEVAKMLSNVLLDTDTVSAMTYALVVDGKEPADFAAEWVKLNADTVNSWFE